MSPANLLAETFADRLRLSTQERGKAIALSGKARSAIPLAGRLGQAYWFDETVGKFVTGTWYTKELPGWLKAFNARNPAETWFSKTWEPLLPRTEYVGEDDRPYEGELYGLGRTFPHPLTGGLPAPGPQSYMAFAISPLSLDMLVQAAKAAIEGESLGKDEVPDLLAVSFSATDRVFHQYGPNSWEMQDTMYRLDKAVGDLVALAERAAGGRANLLVVLSADHGGAAVPEHWAASGMAAERVDPRVLSKGLTEALQGAVRRGHHRHRGGAGRVPGRQDAGGRQGGRSGGAAGRGGLAAEAAGHSPWRWRAMTSTRRRTWRGWWSPCGVATTRGAAATCSSW